MIDTCEYSLSCVARESKRIRWGRAGGVVRQVPVCGAPLDSATVGAAVFLEAAANHATRPRHPERGVRGEAGPLHRRRIRTFLRLRPRQVRRQQQALERHERPTRNRRDPLAHPAREDRKMTQGKKRVAPRHSSFRQRLSARRGRCTTGFQVPVRYGRSANAHLCVEALRSPVTRNPGNASARTA